MKLTSIAWLLLALAGTVLAGEAVLPKTTLEAASGEFWSVNNETFFVFNSAAGKRVTLVGTNIRIECDHLEFTTVGLEKKGETNAVLPPLDKFKYLLATGQVHIVQGEREARAGRAEVFPREDKIELTEQPVVIDHGMDTVAGGVVNHANDNVARGSKITMRRGERRVLIENPVFEAPPIKDLGFDSKSAPPAADKKPK
jgi:lipopolysaccharide export system protein LptA